MNKKCVVLVPVAGTIEPDCERALVELSARGYEVRRAFGHAAIDQARSTLASRALAEGFDEIMWIDSDVAFDPADVDRLRSHELPIACGIYPKKGVQAVSCHVMPGTDALVFGEGGGLVEVLYAATGFLHTRRQVYDDVRRACALPICNTRFDQPVVPYFLPLVVPDGDGHWYLGEDFAFSERARQAGHHIMADTTIRLRHIGKYAYTWEDAGSKLPRFGTYRLNLR
jgi:hypothetical protein